MKLFINLMAVALLVFGFFSPNLASEFSSINVKTFIIICVFLISACVGRWWFIGLKSYFSAKPYSADAHAAIEAVIKEMNRWLQGVFPRAPKSGIVDAGELQSFLNAIRKRFLSSFLFGIGSLGIGLLVILPLEHSSPSRGLFGVLLNHPLGRGVAITSFIYLGISSLSFLVVGLLAFISREK